MAFLYMYTMYFSYTLPTSSSLGSLPSAGDLLMWRSHDITGTAACRTDRKVYAASQKVSASSL